MTKLNSKDSIYFSFTNHFSLLTFSMFFFTWDLTFHFYHFAVKLLFRVHFRYLLIYFSPFSTRWALNLIGQVFLDWEVHLKFGDINHLFTFIYCFSSLFLYLYIYFITICIFEPLFSFNFLFGFFNYLGKCFCIFDFSI